MFYTIIMSGASAVASARRRRAGTVEQPQPQVAQQRNQQNNQQTNQQSNENNQMTPLQILQLHDDKLVSLENDFESRVEEVIKKMNISSNNTNTQNVLDDKLIEEINNKIDNKLSSKLTNINDTIKSILLNIEKLSDFTNINEKNASKIEELINEINALKMLVIKTQTLSLETNGDIIKMKDQIKELQESREPESTELGNMDFMKAILKMSETPIEDSQNIPLNIHDVLDTENNSINSDIETMEEIKTSIQDEIINISNNNEKDETIEIQELSVN